MPTEAWAYNAPKLPGPLALGGVLALGGGVDSVTPEGPVIIN